MKTPGNRGYIFSRAIRGQIVPQRLQNLMVRSYAQGKDLPYLLSATEYYMDHCYMMLDSVLKSEQPEGIIFYSIHMLPAERKQRLAFYEPVLAKKMKIYFALENLALLGSADVGVIEDICLVAGACPIELNF